MDQLKRIEAARKLASTSEYGSDEMDKAWDELFKINETQKDGIYLGRTFTYSVADGQAMYYISKINKKSVRLAHVPEFVDGYMQHGLYEGATVNLAQLTSEAKAIDKFNNVLKKRK